MRAHARVVIAVMRYGNQKQLRSILPYKNKLNPSLLPDYLREELE